MTFEEKEVKMFLLILLSSLVITASSWPVVSINNTEAAERGQKHFCGRKYNFLKWVAQAKLNMKMLNVDVDVKCDSSVSGRPLSHIGSDSMTKNTGMARNTGMLRNTGMTRSSKRSRLAASITCYDQAGFQVILQILHPKVFYH